MKINSIAELESYRLDHPDRHKEIAQIFADACMADDLLWQHRFHCMSQGKGFGENGFHWFWKLIVDEFDLPFRFLEIGVYKGQVTSLIGLLAKRDDKWPLVVGVSSFDGRNLVPPPDDASDHYRSVVEEWDRWAGPGSVLALIEGDSGDEEIADQAREYGPYDIVYIDGDHEFEACSRDLALYGPMVKEGGYLVMDDSALFLHLNWGAFPGFEGSSLVVERLVKPDPQWKEIGSVVHMRLFQKREGN